MLKGDVDYYPEIGFAIARKSLNVKEIIFINNIFGSIPNQNLACPGGKLQLYGRLSIRFGRGWTTAA
jgi:hypothetical protein